MKAAADTKYKECPPGETVERIKEILRGIGLELEEYWGDTGMDGFYTLRVNIPGTGIGSNGKGASRDYAQASAYAEFMERLQNDYMSLGDYDEDTWRYMGFYHAPDEKLMDPAELAASESTFINMLSGHAARVEDKVNMIALWQLPVFPDCCDGFVSVRYYSVMHKCYEYLPYAICLKLYRSNGMCAGNTPEEALVQGLSEIFERHVNLALIKERKRLPNIPDWYLMRYERLYKVIKEIGSSGRYKVLVQDGSLGKGYPVVVLIIIDKERRSYGVRLGAHPEFEIALERALSEALQGKNLEAFTGLSILRFDNDSVMSYDNIINIAKVGIGQYPAELFSGESEYEFEPFRDIAGKSNRELLQDLLKLITSQGYDVLIKDSSYLGFPAYQVISPGFSEIHEADPMKVFEAKAALKVRRILRRLHSATDEELADVVNYLKFKQYSINENTISTLLGMNFKKSFPGENYEHYFLTGACLYRLGKFKEAAFVLGLVAHGTSGSVDSEYYNCVSDYAAAVSENLPEGTLLGILGLFYGADIVKKVHEEFRAPETVIQRIYPDFNCYGCDSCGISEDCNYVISRSIKRHLKEAQATAELMSIQMLGI